MSTFDPSNPSNSINPSNPINPTPDPKLYITILSILSIVFSGYIQTFNLLSIKIDTYKQIKHIGLILLISGSVMLFLTLVFALLKYNYDNLFDFFKYSSPYFIISIIFSGIAIAWGVISQFIIIPTDNSTTPLQDDSSTEKSLETIQILKDFSYSIGIISVFALGFCIGQYMKKCIVKDKTSKSIQSITGQEKGTVGIGVPEENINFTNNPIIQQNPLLDRLNKTLNSEPQNNNVDSAKKVERRGRTPTRFGE
jgi:hypothetical protein